MSDEILNTMIIRTAVMEQIMLNMMTAMSGGFADPEGFRATLLGDVRDRLQASLSRATEPGDRAFAQMSLDYVEDLETRIASMHGAGKKH